MQATSQAFDHLLRAVGDPVSELRDIGPGHPEFHRAQTLRAAVGVLSKTPDALPAIAQVIRTADGLAVPPETRAHLAAADAWVSGDPVLAANRYASVLDRWPRDLLALRLAQSCYFFLGWHDRFIPLIDAVVPAWTRDRRGFDFALAMAAFAHAENGDAAYAEVLGRKALANDPACPVGVHAVAHAMAESGRHLEGAQWMRDQRAHWAGESRMRTHNAWHLAMFDAVQGNIAPALRILDAWLIPASAKSPLDAVTIVLFYHDTVWLGANREAMNRAVFNALKPGGIFLIVDHSARPGDGTNVASTFHRIEEAVVRNEVQAAGFVLDAEADFLRNANDTRDWNDSPRAAGDRRGTSDRFALRFRKP